MHNDNTVKHALMFNENGRYFVLLETQVAKCVKDVPSWQSKR